MNSPPYGQGPRQQLYGPTGQRNSAQCQNQTQGFGHSPFGTSGPNFPVSPGNWNTPRFTQPPPTNAYTFNQPPPPCFSPQSQHCPPPRYGRPVNNVWGDPNLYRPNFGPPPRMCPPDARSQQHHGQFGPPGRGRGGGGCGRGRGGRGGGRGGGKNNQQNGQTHNKNGNGSNHGQESKKAKADKRDLPENNQFHCETCDRGFKTDEKYQQHVLEHKKCSVDGCRYVAAPKLVDLHYHTQHRTGLAKKIWSLESPEDIQKWIQERKRHFPTKENIARRAEDIAERRSRGERIDTKQFGKMRGRGRGRRGQHGRQRHWENDQPQRSSSQERTGSLDSQPDAEKGDKSDRLNHSEGNKPGPSQSASSPSSAISDQSAEFCDRHDEAESTQSAASQKKRTNQKRPRNKNDEHKSDSLTSPSAAKKCRADENRCMEDSAGIKTDKTSGADLDPLSLLIKDEDDMSEEDEEEDEDDIKPQMLKGKALASLISSYGSDDSEAEADDKDEDDKDEEKRENDEESSLPTKASAQPSAPPSTKALSKDPREHRQTNRPQSAAKDHSKKQKQQQQRRQHKPSRKPTLLEMLLAKEIRHERNVIMQCVHYIVKNKFLGVCDGKA